MKRFKKDVIRELLWNHIVLLAIDKTGQEESYVIYVKPEHISIIRPYIPLNDNGEEIKSEVGTILVIQGQKVFVKETAHQIVQAINNMQVYESIVNPMYENHIIETTKTNKYWLTLYLLIIILAMIIGFNTK